MGLPTPPPYLSDKNNVFLKGVSFASGGAGILNSTNNGVIVRFPITVIKILNFSIKILFLNTNKDY